VEFSWLRWHFADRGLEFCTEKIEYQVRHALKGLNYLVMIELAAHEDHGRVVAPHIQGLIWGDAPSRRRRVRFSGGIFNLRESRSSPSTILPVRCAIWPSRLTAGEACFA
jgi:hypothetical protein